MDNSSKTKRQHIDDAQTTTVDEHFQLILNDETLIDSDSTIATRDDLPDWYDSKLYKKAQDFSKQHLAALVLSQTIGLIAVFTVPQILKVLIYTKQSNTICAAFRRYIQTIIHLHKLYICDVDDPKSDWYRSLNVIRWKHRTNSKRCTHAGIGGIYQKDMVLTQFGFLGYTILTPETFGLRITPEDAKALNHFWRVTGYMLGIPDQLNLCRKNAAETHRLCQKIRDVYVDYFKNAPPEFYTLAITSLDGIWYIDLSVDKHAMMALTYRVHGLEYKKLGWYSWLNMKYRDTLIKLGGVPYIGILIRIFFNNLLRFIYWYSEHYGTLYAWLAYDAKDVRIHLYPKLSSVE